MPHEQDTPWDDVDDVALAWLHYVRGSGVDRWFDVHAGPLVRAHVRPPRGDAGVLLRRSPTT